MTFSPPWLFHQGEDGHFKVKTYVWRLTYVLLFQGSYVLAFVYVL